MNQFNKYLLLFSIFLLGIASCSTSVGKQKTPKSNSNPPQISKKQESLTKKTSTKPSKIDSLPEKQKIKTDLPIPTGYVFYDEIKGDLNGDGMEDAVLIIQGTNKEKIIQDEHRGELDRNRLGILIYFNDKGEDILITKNLACFSSENEEGGVYYPPELYFEIEKGKLYVNYNHGRYGYWEYTFRYKDADFELIGYDSSSNYGPIVNRETSINFLTKKRLIRKNINQDAEDDGDEVFEDTWDNIELEALLKLSEIEDFDSIELIHNE